MPAYARAIIAIALCAAGVSCSDLTSVGDTDIVQRSDLGNAAGAEAARLGALASFYTAFGTRAPTDAVVYSSGLISDEYFAGAQIGAQSDVDLRKWSEPSSIGPFVALSKARIAALEAIKGLQAYAPTPRSKTGLMFALVGYTEVFLGEMVCSGVPLGALSDAGPVPGVPLSTSEMFNRAVADFDSASVYAVDSARILNVARIGKGRALLNNAKYAEAAAAVASVPTNFVLNAEFSSSIPTQLNDLYQYSLGIGPLLSVSDREGVNGLDFRSANDPRVPVTLVGKAADGVSGLYTFTKISSPASAIAVATGIEARLIEAEALLQASNAAGALAALNALRATAITPPMAPLTLQPETTSQVNQLFRERAFWMFATGHRQGDLRRLIRQYGRAAETVFPTGQSRPGIFYGNVIVFVPDQTETNNPNYKGCANLGA